MSSERAEQPAAPGNPSGIPGQALAAQREAMGWSVEQVADQLKLAVRQVVALEAGDYEHLPSPAVTRGFVRAYAKLMKMDPAPLVAQIAMDTPPTPDNSAAVTRRASPASFSASKFPSHGKRSSLPVGWIAGGAVAIVAVAAAWHFGLVPSHRSDAEGTAQPVAPAASVPDAASAGTAASATNGAAVETLQNPAVPLISVPGPNAAPAAGAAAGTAQAPAAGAPAPATPAPAPAAGKPPVQLAAPVTSATPAATATVTPAAAGPNALVLNVREDSWIQVTPAKGGAALISRLVKGGSTETVNVDQPVRVVVGNPGGVSATLRGNAVALPAVPGKTLSRVNLQ